ncbi:MAG: sugar phosphate isomerase/epimerase [Planctomycetes bacterium]|nr:sugar phosphate isomerase/epimerase [Planctomycetota bacterium]
MHQLSRRQWLRGFGLGAAALALANGSRALAANLATGCTLSIGTYSMKGMSLAEALNAIADIGYDGAEVNAAPGSTGEPAQLSKSQREDIVALLAKRKLRLTALMENIPPALDAQQAPAEVERLKRVFELARDLGGTDIPVVQTVLGGGKWDERKDLFRDRLGAWQETAQSAGVVLAIKPHRFGAMSRPADAIWLIKQLGDSKWLRMVYDYSHYAYRDLSLEATIAEALPYTAHIAVKDAVQQGEKVVFALPGDGGNFDYAALLKQFYAGGYRGDVCVEVSAMLSGKKDYDPMQAARTSYQNMAEAFTKAGVPRGSRVSSGDPG